MTYDMMVHCTMLYSSMGLLLLQDRCCSSTPCGTSLRTRSCGEIDRLMDRQIIIGIFRGPLFRGSLIISLHVLI